MRQGQLLDGRYRLSEQVGSGGMSVVWRAVDEVLNRPVAVKVLAGPQATTESARLRIRAEARAAAGLWHPHVTNVYDYGESIGESGGIEPYVVMELLPGPTLAQRLAAGPLPPRVALRICAEVAGALAAAHERDVVHRDVKPANIVVTPSGAKVVDFGLAAVAGQPEPDEDGQLLGTPGYLAPERIMGDEVLPASDVYALGLLIHRTLTNHLPWRADTPTQMLTAHVYVEPDPLPAVPGVPAAVNEICDRCLAKNPVDRPSAADVAGVLGAAAGIVPRPADDEPAPPPAAEPAPASVVVGEGRRRRRTALLIGAAAVIVIGAGVFALAGPDPGAGDGGPRAAGPQPSGPAADPTLATNLPTNPTAGPGTGPATRPGASVPGGPTGPAGPNATASNPVPPPPTTGPPPDGVPITARGGVAVVRCEGKKARILSVDPADGYTVKMYRPGPAGQVRTVLVSDTNKSDIKVKCTSGGVPDGDVTETPL